MKKVFILTGEPSGDKLASTVIAKLEAKDFEIKYLSVGGSNLKKLGISSIYDLKEINAFILLIKIEYLLKLYEKNIYTDG